MEDKEAIIEEVIAICEANKKNMYCNKYQLIDMIREVLKLYENQNKGEYMKAKYIFKMIEQLKEKYGFNFKNVETFEDIETVLEDKGFQFYDNRVIDFFKYKTKGE